jgi:pimeloyl-ACP methyl ester carboxylesterase
MTPTLPTPHYFGPRDAPLFGWLQAPVGGTTKNIGIVICNPFGFEEVCAHRSLEYLATRAAQAGIASLRFDYEGTGNSHGDESGPTRLHAWVRSVGHAIDHLKASTGVDNVCLLGLRIGATLAALAATSRADVSALVAIAPVVRGRAYARELRILGHSSDESGGLESAGFVLTAETVAAVGSLDLRALSRSPASRVLIVERDDLPQNPEWHEQLKELGVDVQSESWAGYAAMMEDAQRAKAPVAIADGLLEWLILQAPLMAAGPASNAASPSRALADSLTARLPEGVMESVVRIDTGASAMFGIVSRETRGVLGSGVKRGVVMLNSGSVHQIGPNRLWVEMARRWAARGITVLRLDLSGLGNSPARPGQPENVVYSPEAMIDIRVALAHMRKEEGIDECHLLGLCSGAFHAFAAATRGADVASSIMINPLTYSWDYSAPPDILTEYEILENSKRYRRKIFSPDSWLRLVRADLDLRMIGGIVSRAVIGQTKRSIANLKRLLGGSPSNGLEVALNAAARDDVTLRFVFSEGHTGQEILRRDGRQTLANLLASGKASLDFVSGANHTFTGVETRRQLIVILDRLMIDEARPPAPRATARPIADGFPEPSSFGSAA